LQGLLDKAETQRAAAEKAEIKKVRAFTMFRQSLTTDIKYANQDMDETKKNIAQATTAKAGSEGELTVTTKAIANNKKSKATLGTDCMTKSQVYEAQLRARDEELKALASAKETMSKGTGAANKKAYGLDQVSFLQVGESHTLRVKSSADLANIEVVHFVRDLAKAQHEPALTQLATNMDSAIRLGSSFGANPFAKVKKLIKDMIKKLKKEGEGEASHKAYCDRQLAESNEKSAGATNKIGKLTTKIDSYTTKSTKLKGEVTDLQAELVKLMASDAAMTKLRNEERAIYKKDTKEIRDGNKAVKIAIKTLNGFYGKGNSRGAGIIGTLEKIEGDFSKKVAEMSAQEENAVKQYKETTNQNQLTKVTKDSDVTYKTKESVEYDNSVSTLGKDREGVQAELAAVTTYMTSLKKTCIKKPETYAEKKAKRDAELTGLKEAQTMLTPDGVVFLQLDPNLRGVKAHA